MWRGDGFREPGPWNPILLDWSKPLRPFLQIRPFPQIGRPSVEVVIVPDAKAGGELIAGAMAQLLRHKPDALLGVATGSTPLPIYEALAAKVRSGAVDASRARIAQLDEYVGLPAEHPESYRSVLRREVLEPLGVPMSSFMGPDGTAEDIPGACEAYDSALAEAGVWICRCSGSGRTGTSVSTSRVPRWPRGLGSRP